MKKFRFSLETLLSLKREKEQECEIALAVEAGKLAGIDRRIEEARCTGERVFLAGGNTLGDMMIRETVWKKSLADISALEKPRSRAADRVEKARGEYAEAHSHRAALDRLRDKRQDQWKAEVKREEIKRLDETAKGAVIRKRLTGGDV